ncbi:hypothetical protein A8C32_05240 [Flavivirga aquatica]|uniref:Uncharacterized protein n=1 Tax=Flavivirga aquatica TaxID=1849968 RepID=A0A1E5SHK7_9FLAO|nr:hypothetical protein [Flavivirga aquatica]OEJ98605.1 hypothetical protein A8C32_05240 [Flavivirga aquatica]
MKLLYLFITLLIFSCTSVPKDYLVNNNTCNFNDSIFKITKDEMFFDVTRLKGRELIVVNNEFFKNRFYSYEDGEITNKKTNKKLDIGKWIDYYSDGRIKSVTFIYLNGKKEINKETYYDKQGNITKVIDYEKGYNICWAEAIEIVKQLAKRDIKKYKIDSFYLSRIDLNEFPNSNPEWRVSMKGNEAYNEKDRKNYIIDGVTGKLNRTYTVGLIYDSLDD